MDRQDVPRSRRRRWQWVAGAVALFSVAAAMFGQLAFAATLFSDNFEDGNADGWSKSGGTWAVVTDGSRALQQSNVGSANAREFSGSTSWAAYTVTARVKPTAYGSGGLVGLLARAKSSTTFYRLALLPGNRVQLQVVNSGTVTVLADATRTVSTGTWYTLGLTVSGSNITATVDGAVVGSGTSGVAATGRIGVQTLYATASFDDVTVGDTGTTNPTPTTAGPTPTSTPTSAPPTSQPPTNSLIVAPNGSDANPGTVAAPLATLGRAVSLATPGTTIALRGGTYQFSTNVQIMKDGTAANPYTITSYNGEKVILDGENLPHTPAPLNGSIPNAERGVLHMEADYWRIRDLEIVHGPYAIFCRDCNNNVFDRLVTRDNYESGLQIQGAASNNQVLNLDSYGNRDPRKNGESADGLAIKEGGGSGNVVRGARLWNNVDDGFDAWLFTSPILIENSVAWGNGVDRWGFPDFAGDGNGFKMGGGDPDPPANHAIRNSIAFDNAQGGFIDNGNPGSIRVERNTAWRNGDGGFKFANSTSVLTANLAVANGAGVSLGSSTGSGNSWDIKSTWSAADLASTDPATITGPRNPDGSIRTSSFLRPIAYPNLGAQI
ncbi:right-handed parallel beta-helix repeat-containing protein [Micromonospora sp. NPDC004704]